MKPGAAAQVVLTLAALAAVSGARAGNNDDDSDNAAAAPPVAPEYVDRLIDGGALAPVSAVGGDTQYDSAGLPRYLRIRTVISGASGEGTPRNEDGVEINAGVDTLNYGAFSLAGVMRASPFGGSLSLIERGLPLDGGWTTNNALGTLNSPQIDLARNQYRFFLPTFPVAGLSTEWLHAGTLQLQAGVGEAGQFDGQQLDGFERLGGAVLSAAGQWAFDPRWTVGMQLVDAHGVKSPELTGPDFGLAATPIVTAVTPRIDAVSTYGGLAWRDGPDQDQINFVHSDNNQGPAAFGAWFDGTLVEGKITQNYGAFWLQPNLSWGYLPITADTEGLYYRVGYHGQQWLFDGGVDSARSISGAGVSGTMLTANVRYQIEPTTGIGGAMTYRLSNPNGGDGDLYVESRDRFGAVRVEVEGSYDNNDALTRLRLDQTWNLPVGQRLMTSVFVTDESRDGLRSLGGGGALTGGGTLFGPISWEGNLSYDSTTGAGSTGNVNADIGLVAKLGNRWSLEATYLDNRNQNSNLFAINPIVPIPLTPVVTRSSAFLVSLRYEVKAGSPMAMLGGGADRGGGRIEGRLFLDANGSGEQDAGELGAPNVTILLDGRYASRTDNNGRFEFPMVASGPHEVTVVPDNLPLPWTVAGDGHTTVTVHARETVDVNIAARPYPTPLEPPTVTASAQAPRRPKPLVAALANPVPTLAEPVAASDHLVPAVTSPVPVLPNPVPAAGAPVATSTGVAMVQIGAFTTASLADKGWSAAAAVVPGGIAGKGKRVEWVVKGRATFYRSLITGFASRGEAKALCDELQSAGKDCFVK